MCRLVALLADEPVLLADVLTRPTTGLVRQSFASQERAHPGPTGPSQAYEQSCLNGDGYGLGWYVPETCLPPESRGQTEKLSSATAAKGKDEQKTNFTAPAVVTSSKPAWNDRNLENLAEKVSSPLVFAHVRAAGPSLPVSDATCHPFSCGRLLFMHNGLVGGYQKLLPQLVEELCRYPAAFRVAVEHGLIDSAVAFAYLLVKLGVGHLDKEELALRDFRPDELLTAMVQMINHLCALVEENNITDDSLLNFVLADGTCVIACRYAHPGASPAASTTDPVQSCGQTSPPLCRADSPGAAEPQEQVDASPTATAQATLYLTTGTQWAVAPHDKSGRYRMWQADRRSRMAIISSEPLTSVRDEWLPIPRDTFVICTRAFDLESSGRKAMATVDVFLVPFRDAMEPSQLAWPEHSLPRDAWGPSISSCLLQHTSSQSSLPKVGSDSPESSPRGSLRGPAGFGLSGEGKLWSSLDGDGDGIEVMSSQHSGIGEAPVLCIAPIPPHGVLAVGCSDGGLRFFSMLETAEKEGGPETRHHTGPIFALLVSANGHNSDEEDRIYATGLKSEEVSCPELLLFSASPNEFRVWDMTAVANSGEGPWPDILCLFCFKFLPNPGKVLSLAGDFSQLFLGFQSGKVLSLRIKQHWADIMPSKKARDKGDARRMRTLSFDISKGTISVRSSLFCAGEFSAGEDGSRQTKVRMKALYDSMLSDLGSPHCGGIHGLAYHQSRQILVTAGSDGLLVFWGSAKSHSSEGSPSAMAKISSWPDMRMPLDELAKQLQQGQKGRARSPVMARNRKVVDQHGSLSPFARYPGGRPIFSFTLDKDSEELFVGDAAGRIQVWGICNAVLGAGVKAAFGPRLQAAIMSMQLIQSPTVTASGLGERWLLSGDTDGRICVWDVTRSVLIKAIDGLRIECVSGICWFAGGEGGSPLRLAFGGSVGGVHIFGGDAKGVLHSITMHKQTLGQRGVVVSRRVTHSDEFALLKAYLQRLVAIQSHCDRPDEKQRAGAWLSDHFEKLIGASVRVCSDGTVLARCGWEPDRPLFVLYSHYDVVPAGDGWEADPWTVQGKDGYLMGRGTTDCKGPILAQIFAVRQLQFESRSRLAGDMMTRQESGATESEKDFIMTGLDPVQRSPVRAAQDDTTDQSTGLPFNLLFVVDANEELGSPGLFGAIKEAREHGWLGSASSARSAVNQSGGAPVGVLVSNSTWIDDSHPCVCYGMRGLLDVEVTVSTGGSRDIHTANAGLFPEPFFDLSALLGSLVDASGRIQVPGFTAKVRSLPEAERRNFEKIVDAVGEARLQEKLNKSLGFSSSADCEDAQEGSMESSQPRPPSVVPCLSGSDFRHRGVEVLKQMWSLPSLSVLSVSSGASNTCGRLITKDASAVISARTVPGQEPADLVQSLQSHLDFEFAKRRSGNLLKVTPLCAFRSWECAIDGPESALLFRAARRGVQQAWELENEEDVLAIREGSTIPALTSLQAELGCEAIQLPLGQASDAQHLPDERISEKNLARGVQAIYHTLQNLADLLADHGNLLRVRQETIRRLSARPDDYELFAREDSLSSGPVLPPPLPLDPAGTRQPSVNGSSKFKLPDTNPWSPRGSRSGVHYMCNFGRCSLCLPGK
mmetsp:Transcript_42216/g.99091  ORF Transcript_42216/g.99091 Transcript_42216/m.99091 type:complete len:1616 (-) Transcript_42216:73-4920(-)